LDWITGAFIIALSLYVSLYLCPFFRAGSVSSLCSLRSFVANSSLAAPP
jgi:hypothetical protein